MERHFATAPEPIAVLQLVSDTVRAPIQRFNAPTLLENYPPARRF